MKLERPRVRAKTLKTRVTELRSGVLKLKCGSPVFKRKKIILIIILHLNENF